MDTPILKDIWKQKYEIVSEQLKKIKTVQSVATGFNANIDAVYHMSGQKLSELIKKYNLSVAELTDITHCQIIDEIDFIKGVFKTFTKGIAEEWICENKHIYDWLQQEIGYDKLQIGGQGGIIANVLSNIGVQKVVAHANSLPAIQAAQFSQNENLFSFDENGEMKQISKIDRKNDIPLMHWIIEFKRGDRFELEGVTYKCPRANRFIATYDPLNLNLVLDENFMNYLQNENFDFVMLSGFHALLSQNNGESLIKNVAERLKKWKEKAKDTILHIEVASTQDTIIRTSIAKELLPLADSIGINERETIDFLEVMGEKSLAQRCEDHTTSENLIKGLAKIKEKTGVKRAELHMFGLYATLQDRDFKFSNESNLNGMITASVVAASKAKTGEVNLQNIKDITYEVSDVGLIELSSLALALSQPELPVTGQGRCRNWELTAVPTILIENPISLVGMGDTISALSLIAAR